MLTFEQLQTFCAIVEAKTFTRAAEDLLLTQPAISQRVRRLEQALGAEIFDRRTKGREFALTPTGARVLRFADEVLGLLVELQEEIARERVSRHHQTVTLVCDPWGSKTLIPTLLAAFHDRLPEVRVQLVHCSRDKINAMVTDGDADIGVQTSPHITTKFEVVPILRDHMVLLAPPDHPVLTEPWRRATHIAESGFVLSLPGHYARHVAEEWAASQGFNLDVVLESPSNEMVKEAVIRGLGLTILPELWLRHDLQEGRLAIVPVAGLPQEFQVCLIARAGRTPSPAARALLEVARDGRWREQMGTWQPVPEAVQPA
ncbi:MAG: LysR family transcriptional regulator [Dehalococcoidia bacterium]